MLGMVSSIFLIPTQDLSQMRSISTLPRTTPSIDQQSNVTFMAMLHHPPIYHLHSVPSSSIGLPVETPSSKKTLTPITFHSSIVPRAEMQMPPVQILLVSQRSDPRLKTRHRSRLQSTQKRRDLQESSGPSLPSTSGHVSQFHQHRL